MITVIIDQKSEHENDLLSSVKSEILIVKNLEGSELFRKESNTDWTYESINEALSSEDVLHLCKDGADVYLGDQWIGSTEV